MKTAYQVLLEAGITIKRARGRYLYADNGRRILDMSLDGGRLILGRRTEKSQLIFKNLLEQGVVSALPSVQLHRLERSVVKALVVDGVIPGAAVCLGSDGVVFLSQQSSAGLQPADDCTYICVRIYCAYRNLFSAIASYETERAANGDVLFRTWTPFLPSSDDAAEGIPLSLYVPNPFPLAEAPYIAVFLYTGSRSDAERNFASVAPSDEFSPAVIGGSARAFDDLSALLLSTNDDAWALYDDMLLTHWTRRGAWLYPRTAQQDYDSFVSSCLAKNILISPEYSVPSIVPLGAGLGELKKL